MTGLLRSLLRVRLLWLPAVGVLFALAAAGVGRLLPVGGGTAVVVAGLLVASAVLALGLLQGLWS